MSDNSSRIRRQRQTSQVFPRADGHIRDRETPPQAGEPRFADNFPGVDAPQQPADYAQPPPEGAYDDGILVDWDWLGNTQAWVHRYTSTNPQNAFESVMTFRTPPSEDGMANLVLNDAGEYVLAGFSTTSFPGSDSDSLIPPHPNDLPPLNSNSASSSSSSSGGLVGGRGPPRDRGALGAIRGDLELPEGPRGQRRFALEDSSDSERPARQRSRQDIQEVTRAQRRFALEDSSDESNSGQNSSTEAQYESARQTPNVHPFFQFHPQQGQAGEERARRLHLYDGRESQGSEFLPSAVRDGGLRAALMPNFLQTLQQKLEEHFVNVKNAVKSWPGTKVTWFAVMAICIPILLILRGMMMGYPLMIGTWLSDLGREMVCSFRGFWRLRVLDIFGEGTEFKYDC